MAGDKRCHSCGNKVAFNTISLRQRTYYSIPRSWATTSRRSAAVSYTQMANLNACNIFFLGSISSVKWLDFIVLTQNDSQCTNFRKVHCDISVPLAAPNCRDNDRCQTGFPNISITFPHLPLVVLIGNPAPKLKPLVEIILLC